MSFADSKKDFFNNIFFPVKDRAIPMNLYNINFNCPKDYDFNDTETINKKYNFEQPNKIFLLPSSDESGNESKNIFIPSFNQICEDIIDFSNYQLAPEKKDLPNNIFPVVTLRVKEPLINVNKALGFVKSYLHKDPYEIKMATIHNPSENKDTSYLNIKFYSYEDAVAIKECLQKTYGIQGKLCFDKRDLPDSKWYCVIFRIEGGGEQKLSKFVQLMDDIFKDINDKNKEFIETSLTGSCEGQINNVKCIKKLGEVFYCAIKVGNLEQALALCVKYNNMHGLKVNLHNLSLKTKKHEIPQVLISNELDNERPKKNHLSKTYKEDQMYKNDLVDRLFFNRKILNKKHKRNKNKQ